MCAGEGKKRTSKLFETKSTLNFKKKNDQEHENSKKKWELQTTQQIRILHKSLKGTQFAFIREECLFKSRSHT